MPREPSDPQGVPRRPPHDQTDPRGRRPPRDPTDPRGQRPARERTDPRGQREAAGPPRVLPMVPTLVIGAALVLLAFVLGNVTSGGGGDEASVTAATVASTTTTTRVVKHTVARGESLLGIASRYGVTAEALAAANGITNQNHVFVGQVLTIPPTTAVAPAPTTTTTVEIPTGK
jgi:nucleoid-associated protein YgaU